MAAQGGNFYCNSCTMTFTSTTFLDSMANEGGNFYLVNTASLSLNSVTMNHGRAYSKGGSIYTTGTGVSPIIFSNCAANVEYFWTNSNGGFMYFDNPGSTFSSTNCNYNHMYA